ncbi:MAG: helix-turn-helix transcriptional regulator [Lachnospiraceae bacterium]|nr:helix-turn-helix transcriptional regulator [Lachnospiraceae bacterium]
MISERLTCLRKDTGKTQNEVADELHIARSTYSSYETGRRTPQADALVSLARYFGTTSDYLLGLSDEPRPAPPLDEKGLAVVRCYRDADFRGRETIYRIALQEKIQYGGADGAPEP